MSFIINKDAFSNGQIDSKLWMCRELEKLDWESNLTHIYGGWYGIAAFLLLTREKFKVNKIRSFDVDPSCENMADMINENYVFKEWKFKAFTKDCNTKFDEVPDLIINTSSEHFDEMTWFNNIKPGTRVLVQGNNMQHDDHVLHTNSLDDFTKQYPLNKIAYAGTLDFVYPDWKFTRYMLIGEK